jgi:Sec-independent protein secretion pathway component TatC
MINLDDTFFDIKFYLDQRDLSIKIISYSTGILVFIESLRQQLPEINLLQLIPGFYLLLLFVSLFLIVTISDFFVRLPIALEQVRGYGLKNSSRMFVYKALSWGNVFFFILILFGYNTVIPISLDSFNSYGEKTLENLWSFNEVLNLEIILICILIILSQSPITILFFLINEEQLLNLPKIWKYVTILIVIFSGILTPTIDGYTQINLSIIAFFLYLIIICFLEKRTSIAFIGNSVLGF